MSFSEKEKAPLLALKNLNVDFSTRGKTSRVVENLSFGVFPSEILAIVGESGSGKTVSSQAITRLLPAEPHCKISGEIYFDGREISNFSEKDLQKIRGKEIAYIFQDPQSSLNPTYRIGWQIDEVLKIHLPAMKKDASAREERIKEVLKAVGLKPDVANMFPHELSGGMQQRAMIAMAIACEPKILIADEPTTALDVTVQKQIIELLRTLRKSTGMSIILITHNLALVAEIADRVCVMFRGKKVEEGCAKSLISNPQHPYTKALLDSVPRLKFNKQTTF